ADARRARASVHAQPAQGAAHRRDGRGAGCRAGGGLRLMEAVYALAIGVLVAAGVWLLLRPRTFQVIMGFSLLSYATNLFIFGMGRLEMQRPPILDDAAADAVLHADPVPQALVLTAIVIGFA